MDSELLAVSVEAPNLQDTTGLCCLSHSWLQYKCYVRLLQALSWIWLMLDQPAFLSRGSCVTWVLHCRELGPAVATVSAERIRPIQASDFQAALLAIKPSVNQSQLALFEQWTEAFGTAS